MKYLLILITTAILGCGKAPNPPVWDTAFDSSIKEFMAQAVERDKDINDRMQNLTVEFGVTATSEDPTAIGWCIWNDDNTKNIIISQNYWNSTNVWGQREVLFHELGHCVLDREHDTNMVHGRPESIMYPDALDPNIFQQFYSSYMDELFK